MSRKPGSKRATVLREIHRLREQRNRSSVKAAVVSEHLEFTPKEVAPVLQRLESAGLLDSWGNSTPTTYMIDFDPSDVDVSFPGE